MVVDTGNGPVKKAPARKKKAGLVDLVRLKDYVVTVRVKGIKPVIPHKWSEKAKAMMPGHPEGDTVKTKKGLRQPEEEAEACLYRLPDNRVGMPAAAFKAAIVGACRFFDAPSMAECKLLVFVEGEGPDELVAIDGELELHEDTPRNASGTADLRYRYYVKGWSATLRVRFVATSVTPSSIVTLIDAGGRGGVGDWRPSAPKSYTGTFGTWRVDDTYPVDIQEVTGG